jgi:fused signal recognition particle receptor
MIWSKLTDGISGIFTKRKLDGEALSELEDLLIEADMGAKTAGELVAALSKHAFEKDISPQEVKEFLAGEIARRLQKVASPFAPDVSHKPAVVMVVGVNGSGKTTTIGKLAAKFKGQGHRVMMAAADTFRAAATEQLQEWGRRSDIPVVTGEHASDPASVAYRAYEQAKAAGADILFIDTAGRLHNKANLMDELQKISKVLKKIDAGAPHDVILVLDATIGQNTLAQVQAFKEMVQVNGLIVTKLDGTAKGGVVVALAAQFGLPVHMVGVGEGINDLTQFEPIDFSRNLVGLTS